MNTTCKCGKAAKADLNGHMLNWHEFEGAFCEKCFIDECVSYASTMDLPILLHAFRFNLHCALYGQQPKLAVIRAERAFLWNQVIDHRETSTIDMTQRYDDLCKMIFGK